MFADPDVLISGISPYASWRGASLLGFPEAFVETGVTPLGLEAFLPRLSVQPLMYPKTVDEFFPAMGASRDLLWVLMSYGQFFSGELQPKMLGIPKIAIKYEQAKVKNCEAANAHLDELSAKRDFIARANMDFTKPKLSNVTSEKMDDGEFRCTIDLALRLDLDKSWITFPKLILSKMSNKDRETLRRFNLDLMVHEIGHFWVAAMILWHAKKKFEGFGPSAKQAENDARQLIADHVASLTLQIGGDERKGIKGDSDRYDDATEHGKAQSQGPDNTFNVEGKSGIPFPGGRNVILDC